MKNLLFIFIFVIGSNYVKSQNSLTLTVDSFYQPLQTFDVSDVDTLIIKNFFSILIFLKPYSPTFDVTNWYVDSMNFNICGDNSDSTSFDCQLSPDSVFYDATNQENVYYYYNIPDCRSIVVTHQISPVYYNLEKKKDCVLSNNELDLKEEDNFTLFPNPSNGLVNVEIEQEGTFNLIIVNPMGQQVYQQRVQGKQLIVDLKALNLSAGIYLFKLMHEQSGISEHKKIIYHGTR